MKQNTVFALFLKTVATYYLSCIVCTFIFSLFYYFNVMNATIYMNTLYGCSIVASIIACAFLIKHAEKKTLFYILGFLLFIFALSLIASFSLSNLLKSAIRLLLCFVFSFIILIRK